LLLEARVLFDKMVKIRWAKEQKEIEEQRKREKQERVTRDGLRIPEIQSVLKSQPDSDEGDWISGASPPPPPPHNTQQKNPNRHSGIETKTCSRNPTQPQAGL